MADISTLLETDIKRKLQTAFDTSSLYSVFETLITAISEQQDEMKLLNAKFSKFDDMENDLSNIRSTVKRLEFDVEGTSDDGTHLSHATSSRFEPSSPVRKISNVEEVQESEAENTNDDAKEFNLVGAPAHALNSKLLENAKIEYEEEKRRTTAAHGYVTSVSVEEEAETVVDPELEREVDISPEPAVRKTNWRSKRHRLLLALQVKGHDIKRARLAAERINRERKLNPQRTTNHRIRTLEMRVVSLTERGEVSKSRIDRLESQITEQLPHDLPSQIGELKAKVDHLNTHLLQVTKERDRLDFEQRQDIKVSEASRFTAKRAMGAVGAGEGGGRVGGGYGSNKSSFSLAAGRNPDLEDTIKSVVRAELDSWAQEHQVGPYSIYIPPSQNPGRRKSSLTQLHHRHEPRTPSPIESDLDDHRLEDVWDDDIRRLRNDQSDIREEANKLRDMLFDLRNAYISRNELIGMMSLEEDPKPAASPLAERLRMAIDKHVRHQMVNKANREEVSELQSEFKSYQSSMSEFVDNSIRDAILRTEKENTERTLKFDTKLRNLTKMMREVETTTRPATLDDQESLRPELEKFNERIQKTDAEHRRIAAKFAEDLDAIQEEMGMRPNEKQVQNMVRQVEDSLKRQLGETNEDLSSTVTKIVGAVRNKASKDEVLRIIMDRLASVEIANKANTSSEETDPSPAGAVKCISCGSMRGSSSPPKQMSGELPADMIPGSRVDYEQLVDVMNRNAGLRSLSRQYHPMTPKQHPYVKKPKSTEPLFKRAQLASHLKEMVKAPTPVLSASKSLTTPLYFVDESTSVSPGNSVTGGIKLPGVQSQGSINSSMSAPNARKPTGTLPEFNDDVFTSAKQSRRK